MKSKTKALDNMKKSPATRFGGTFHNDKMYKTSWGTFKNKEESDKHKADRISKLRKQG